MARYLFVVPPLAGHVNPTIAVGRALAAAGHTVAWTGCESRVRALLPPDLRLIPVDEREVRKVNESWHARAQSVHGLDSFKFFFEEFLIPLADAMVPGVLAAIEEFRPDGLICDQQALAGAIAARKKGLPWVTLATTSAAVFNPMEQFPKVWDWMIEKQGQLQDRHGLERRARPDLSERLVVIFSTHALVGSQHFVPSNYEFVGPSIRSENQAIDFPWERLDAGLRKIYLSLGTLNAERSRKFYDKVKEAFGGRELQLILSAPPEMLGELPSNFIVQRSVPQLELLKRVDAVIFHGGHNTFCESLAAGLPLVVAPIKDDQPVIAEQVVRSGVGLRVHFDRVKSADLYEAARRVCDEPQFRAAAKAVQATFQVSGGAGRAAELIRRAFIATPQAARAPFVETTQALE